MENEEKNEQAEPVEVEDSWWLVRGSNGKGSVSTTLLLVSFVVTTLAYLVNMFDGKIGPLEIKDFDAGAAAAYFVPICTLYFARRHTESKTPPVATPES